MITAWEISFDDYDNIYRRLLCGTELTLKICLCVKKVLSEYCFEGLRRRRDEYYNILNAENVISSILSVIHIFN